MRNFFDRAVLWMALTTTVCVLGVIGQGGCGKEELKAPGDDSPRPSPPLCLLVVDDPQMAMAIRRTAGQWRSEQGGALTVKETTAERLGELEQFQADAVICAPAHIGFLAVGKKIVPLNKQWLAQSAGHFAGVFDLLRLREAGWGEQTYAVPFGSPVLVCYYRADLFEKFGRKPPRTWAEYQQLAEFFANRENLGPWAPPADQPWSGTLEPLAPGWASLMLIARAAPYVKHRNNFSTLLDIDSLEPLIGRTPWLRAVDELIAASKTASHNTLAMDPHAVRTAFWQGQCAMAITWPTAAHGTPAETSSATAAGTAGATDPSAETRQPPKIEVAFVELPGSREVFDIGRSLWTLRGAEEDQHVPLLSVAGRVGVVTANSPHAEDAYRLLVWLSDATNSPQVCAVSPATTIFRREHLQAPQLWVEREVSAPQAAQYANVVKTALMREQWVDGLRIPGRAEYLTALDEAVHQAVRGELAPLEALAQAMARWREITRRIGTKQQKLAYLRSLGLDELP